MKKLLVMLLITGVAAGGLFCSGGGGSAEEAGGPGVSPDDIAKGEEIVLTTNDTTLVSDPYTEAVPPALEEAIAESEKTGNAGTGSTGSDNAENSTVATTIPDADPSTNTGSGDSSTTVTGSDTATDVAGDSSATDTGSDSATDIAGDSSAPEPPAIDGEFTPSPYRTITLDTTKGKWYKADGFIHTFWANQSLYMNVANNNQAGWYYLTITAKNYTSLVIPPDYENFNISVTGLDDNRAFGGALIAASDTKPASGKILIYLPEGDSSFNLLWTNDSYTEGKYDANIQIQGVELEFAGSKHPWGKSLVRQADQYSFVEGRWFWDANRVRTNWANQTLGFLFPELEAGQYEVTVWAKNHGVIPPNYKGFDVVLNSHGAEVTLNIPLRDKGEGWNQGSAVIDLVAGDVPLYLTWINDAYKKDVYDANIQIHKIQLKRVGKSNRSAIAAYLMYTQTGNRVALLGSIVLIGSLLGGLTVYNRRKMHKA